MKAFARIITKITLIAALFAGLWALDAPAHADILDDLKKIFTEDQELSFRQYEGELAELSPKGYDEGLTSSSDLKEFILRVVNFALGFLGIFAVLIVIYGGILYISAAGEQERADKGKKAISFAVIGLLIVMVSFALVNTIIRGALLGDEGNNGPGTTIIGSDNVGNSFNAASIQIHSIAKEIYQGFLLLAETTEEIRAIRNDILKTSLSYKYSLIGFNDMISFMTSSRIKLQNLQQKVPKFSNTYVAINTLLLEVTSDIDNLQNIPHSKENTYAKIINQNIEFCIDNPENATIELVKECEAKGYAKYSYTLYKEWEKVKGKYLTNTGNWEILLDPIKEDYIFLLEEKMSELHEIRDRLTGIAAVESGDAGSLFEEMMGYYGFGFSEYKKYVSSQPLSYSGGYMAMIQSWTLEANQVTQAGNTLVNALKVQLKFAEEVGKLKAVKVRLRANVASGNAPLIVRFDVLDTIDPAGGSIIDKNVKWDNIKGNTTFEGKDVNIQDAVRCTKDGTFDPAADKEVYGPAFNECIFKYPGTYVATVTVESNDAGKYVAGMSTLIIKVDPPKTKINLKLKIGSKEETVMEYYENGILKTDLDYIAVTLEEASKKGITFDAGKTANVSAFSWNFGNGTRIEDASTHTEYYEQEGTYRIELEVMNTRGEIDRKVFTLEVRAVAARIRIVPEGKVFVGQSVTFDGSESAVTHGMIKSYDWKITRKDGQEVAIGETLSTQKSFSHQFKEPGIYTVDLKVASNVDNKVISAKPVELVVVSQPPVAVLDITTPDQNQPALMRLSALKSYDPDGIQTAFSYKWTIESAQPGSKAVKTWQFVNSGDADISPWVKFLEKGDYLVTLTVTDSSTLSLAQPEKHTVTQTITIKDTLDIAWAENQPVTLQLSEGEAKMSFAFISENGIAYEIKFGDGEVGSGNIVGGVAKVSHTYRQAGKMNVQVTVFDEDDNDKTLSRTILIGQDNMPVAVISVQVNGTEIHETNGVIEIGRKETITFDAGNSTNLDGTGRKLNYSWNFGDTGKSSQRTATYTYKELSPTKPGYFTITLKVFDKDDPTLTAEDKIKVRVINREPRLSGLQAVPVQSGEELITPVKVNLKAHGAEDPDGEIVQYRWWYYNLGDPSEPLGIQITNSPEAVLIIGTNGKEGQLREYGFGVELMDSDNQKISSYELLKEGQLPKVTVKNGPNILPTAKFTTSKTKLTIGEEVQFTSASTDPDGKITAYIWDLEGDGFFNNPPSTTSTIAHIFTGKNLEGIPVKLKVVDDKGGEHVSESLKIYVDSNAKPPKAAFTHKVEGMTVEFTSNSTSDKAAKAEIAELIWDFDTTGTTQNTDSDGDGEKDNDKDAIGNKPQYTYSLPGVYQVKLTVRDTHGNQDEVVRTVEIKESSALPPETPPESSQKLQAVVVTTPAPAADGKIYLEGESGSVKFDFKDSKGPIAYYIFDKNIYFDTNINGVKNDDEDFKTALPGTWKTNFEKKWGKTVVKFTVIDIYGNTHHVLQEIVFK